ncbi:MAG: DUF503 domain-containing protein [Candidatus Krumholzibacteriota bacterium]|nr:DUF503 domain-containing protein [Candidatus Krumholzibacteriota bacterium]
MIVARLKFQFHLPDCNSLKEKRYLLNSLKDRLRNRFNVALCETGYQDNWRRSEIGLVTITGTRRGMDKTMQSLMSFLEREHRVVLMECEKEFY